MHPQQSPEIDKLMPAPMRDILADPPLLRGEDESAYRRLVAHLGTESGATTAAEWLSVKDVADLTWQIARIRRWLSAYMASGERCGLATAIERVIGDGSEFPGRAAEELADELYADPERAAASTLLAQRGLSPKHLGGAHAFFKHLRSIVEAEELMMRLEHRRDRAMDNIEVRRRAFGEALRAAATRVVDVDAIEHRSDASPLPAPSLPAADAGNA